LGSKAWEFATPLLLLQFQPGSLFAPVAFGLFLQASSLFAGPAIGTLVDKARSRLTVVTLGCGVQAVTSLAAVGILGLLFASRQLPTTAADGPGEAVMVGALGGMPGPVLILFLCLCGCGVVEGLSSGAVSVAVSKDWVPSVFDVDGGDESEATLTRLNAAMSRIDLVAEFAGPALAGFVLVACGPDHPLLGFFAIAAFNAFTFLPQVVGCNNSSMAGRWLNVTCASFCCCCCCRCSTITLFVRAWRAPQHRCGFCAAFTTPALASRRLGKQAAAAAAATETRAGPYWSLRRHRRRRRPRTLRRRAAAWARRGRRGFPTRAVCPS